MSHPAVLSTDLLLAYTAYFVGTASPGPSNLAIMSVATTQGRKAALAFAAGVVSGSMCWAVLATLGLSVILVTWSKLLVAVKVFGGLYLLWLASKSARAALTMPEAASKIPAERSPLTHLYSRGLLLHLTNPKAILVWVSIVALGSPGDAHGLHAAVVPGCAAIGICVFSGYAMLFSTQAARRLYQRMRRALEASLAVVFAFAGVKLLTSRG